MENQDLVHYAMPIRVIYEEGLTYHRRLEEIQKTHHEKKDLKTGAEFLGGFSKEDRVPAVVSLVIYYGRKPWDGATDLYDLLDMSGIPEEMRFAKNNIGLRKEESTCARGLKIGARNWKRLAFSVVKNLDNDKVCKKLLQHYSGMVCLWKRLRLCVRFL